MSKSEASEYIDAHETPETNMTIGDVDSDLIIDAIANINLTPSTTVSTSTAPAATDQFMFTNDFKRYLVEFVPDGTLMA
ncbi:hypothetical protein TL16_g01866 [Triparma laevis f. inornata]|uniref:Uncharacterized protein n=1 Tax=Triparma laevis f. inornata TaxID=1714386 RepID=A0A9W6ZSR2_9STRA|nr:hypothetical protein TL16_g01866 [Triparma laevis f. inornata]